MKRRIEGEHPYLYLDGIVMKRSWAGEVRNVSLLVVSWFFAVGLNIIAPIGSQWHSTLTDINLNPDYWAFAPAWAGHSRRGSTTPSSARTQSVASTCGVA